MGRRRALLASTALSMLVGASAAAEEPVVDRIVAVVKPSAQAEARVLTLSRVEEEARVALVARGGALAATAPLDDAALRAGLEWAIDQTLLAEEASRLQVLEADPADVAAELQRFKARFASPGDFVAFLARVDASEDEVAGILRRTLAVKRYVEGRVGRGAAVTDAEVAAYVAAHARELPRGQEAARAAARGRLEEERAAGEVRSLVADLRSRAEVRVLYELGGRAPATPALPDRGVAAAAAAGRAG